MRGFFFATAARPFRLFRYYFICKHSFVFRQTLYSPNQLLSCCWMMCNGVQKKTVRGYHFCAGACMLWVMLFVTYEPGVLACDGNLFTFYYGKLTVKKCVCIFRAQINILNGLQAQGTESFRTIVVFFSPQFAELFC